LTDFDLRLSTRGSFVLLNLSTQFADHTCSFLATFWYWLDHKKYLFYGSLFLVYDYIDYGFSTWLEPLRFQQNMTHVLSEHCQKKSKSSNGTP